MSSKKVRIVCAFLFLYNYFSGILCDSCRDKPNVNGDASEGKVLRRGLTGDEIKVLAVYHDIHTLHDMKTSMVWDKDLQIQAQHWADQCKNYKDQCRTSDKYKTVYQVVAEEKDGRDLAAIVKRWFHDNKQMDFYYKIIDRFRCGLKKTMDGDCRYVPGYIQPCCKVVSNYSVCNYAATSENN